MQWWHVRILSPLTGALMSTDTYSHKLALITGGSSGIGLAIAKNLADRGANVCILARDPQKLKIAHQEIAARCASPQQYVETISADVSDRQQIFAVLQDLVAQKGTPDFLFNCAGVVHPGTFAELDPEIFAWTDQINYLGTVYTTRALIPSMIARRSGHIVNFSSILGFLGMYGYTAYCGSKYAVRGFSDALRAELKLHDVKVSVVYPGDTQTPQLEYEARYKPAIAKMLWGESGIMPADVVAAACLRQIARGRYVITPGLEATALYSLITHTGNLVYPIVDALIRGAARKLATSERKGAE